MLATSQTPTSWYVPLVDTPLMMCLLQFTSQGDAPVRLGARERSDGRLADSPWSRLVMPITDRRPFRLQPLRIVGQVYRVLLARDTNIPAGSLRTPTPATRTSLRKKLAVNNQNLQEV